MKIVRLEMVWMVFGKTGTEAGALHRLAFDCGYRIGELGDVLSCSERYLYEVFVRDIGKPPKKWMREERMAVARRMLRSGGTPEAVSEALGFSSANNFRREFLAFHPMPPAHFRQTSRGERAACGTAGAA